MGRGVREGVAVTWRTIQLGCERDLCPWAVMAAGVTQRINPGRERRKARLKAAATHQPRTATCVRCYASVPVSRYGETVVTLLCGGRFLFVR